jgi:hypothetical protein
MADAAEDPANFGPGDPAQERALAQRRAREAARLQRITNPKQRIMGIDSDALAQQVAEKKAAAAEEKALRAEYDNQRLQQDAQLAYLEQERLRAERTKAQHVDAFRTTYQGREKAREYDLNDPLSKLNDLPGRTADDDGRLSVSGLQKFHGEDLSYAQRVKAQQEELRQWCAELSQQKMEKQAEETRIAAEYAERAVQIDQMKTDLESTARSARTQTNVAVAEYQLAQAAAKREREAAAQKAEMQDNVEEIQKNLAADLLTENPAVGRSFAAANRLRPDHYKGMSPAEQQAIWETQEAQRQQGAALKAASKQEERAADHAIESTRRMGAYQDAQVAAMRADMRKKVMEENADLAKQQFAAKSYLASNVFTNSIDVSFFNQFGTTSR